MTVAVLCRSKRVPPAVVAAVLAVLMFAVPVQATCEAAAEGRVLAPTEPPGEDHGPGPCAGTPCIMPPVVGGYDFEVPSEWWGKPFLLSSGASIPCIGCTPTNPLGTHPDLAVRWYAADGYFFTAYDGPGDERGTVPEYAVTAKVTYEGTSLDRPFWLYVDCPKA